MTHDIQYSIEAGAMRRVDRPMHKRPWLMFFVCILFFGIGLAGPVYFYRNLIVPQENTIVISQQAYDELIQIRQNQDVSNELLAESLDMSITPDQLGLAFDATFGDVRLSPEKRKAYLAAVSKWSTHYAMPPLLVLSMIWRESTFDEKTVSSANARGPMQVIYRHHAEKLTRIGKGEQDLHTIDVGVQVGIAVLREYFDRYDRNIFRAMAAYVGGQHRTYAQDIMTRYFKGRIFLNEYLKKVEEEEAASLSTNASPAKKAAKDVGATDEKPTEDSEKPDGSNEGDASDAPKTLKPAGLS